MHMDAVLRQAIVDSAHPALQSSGNLPGCHQCMPMLIMLAELLWLLCAAYQLMGCYLERGCRLLSMKLQSIQPQM